MSMLLREHHAKDGDTIIGVIGVSGGTVEQDEIVAQAGVAASG